MYIGPRFGSVAQPKKRKQNMRLNNVNNINNINKCLIGSEGVEWIYPAQNRVHGLHL